MKKSITFVKGFINKVGEEESTVYAYQLTYGLLLSIFPFLIFLFTLIAYLGLDANSILDLIRNNLPEDIYEIINGTVVELVNNKQGTILSASVFLAIYSSSRGFRAFMTGVNQSMGLEDNRSIIYKYIISILWVIQLAVTILLALGGIVFGRQILNLIASYIPQFPTDGIIDLLRLAIPVALLFFVLALAYMFVPAKNLRFKYAYPGAIFSTVTWIGFTVAFQFYINNYANYSRFYGALGAVIGLLLWLNLTSIIMILGSSLNAYLIEYRAIKRPYIKDKRNGKETEGEDLNLVNKDREKSGLSATIPERKFETLRETFKKTLDVEDAKEVEIPSSQEPKL